MIYDRSKRKIKPSQKQGIIVNKIAQKPAGQRKRWSVLHLLSVVMCLYACLFITYTIFSLKHIMPTSQGDHESPKTVHERSVKAVVGGESNLQEIETENYISNEYYDYDYRFIKDDEQYSFDRDKAETWLKSYGAPAVGQFLSAYVEPKLNDTVPGTGSLGNPKNDKDNGEVPEFVIPLPIRKHAPDSLKKYEYSSVRTCHDIPSRIPINYPFLPLISPFENVGSPETPDNFAELEAPYCPVESDPFLPWIHDFFPNQDGTLINFIAQNKRRCRTGRKFGKHVESLVPQSALFQPISVERITNDQAKKLAPELWQESGGEKVEDPSPRYRLAPRNESSPDGMFTRFICRFHSLDTSALPADGSNKKRQKRVILGETLSVYPFNYEFVSYRKPYPSTLLTPKGKDSHMFWTSTLMFQCPVPKTLQPNVIASGSSILSDGTPMIHVDLIPIRTSARYGFSELYLSPELAGPKKKWQETSNRSPWNNFLKTNNNTFFDPVKRWGPRNVLPRVEASGRWMNIPLCTAPQPGLKISKEENNLIVDAANSQQDGSGSSNNKEENALVAGTKHNKSEKRHMLSACLWASVSFTTRGKGNKPITDTLDRLVEWITFHLMAGFDHIYVYDNSGAHTNETSLLPILQQFSSSQVTHIDWPSQVCNNNRPADDNTGERSSQYAAENSCRTRYAPYTEWIAAFDTDEYLVPMGNYTNLKDVLNDAKDGGTNILSFRSVRGKLRNDKSSAGSEGEGREMNTNLTFLDAYNCDPSGLPKPGWADRARKQVYRSDFVLYHFVHYSTVTQGYLTTYEEQQEKFRVKYTETSPLQRSTDELNEAVMIHTKSTPLHHTWKYKEVCAFKYPKKFPECTVGFPWPQYKNGMPEGAIQEKEDEMHDTDGMKYNCFINDKVENYWVPRLADALDKHKKGVAMNVKR